MMIEERRFSDVRKVTGPPWYILDGSIGGGG